VPVSALTNPKPEAEIAAYGYGAMDQRQAIKVLLWSWAAS
jgi:hypothetical protein